MVSSFSVNWIFETLATTKICYDMNNVTVVVAENVGKRKTLGVALARFFIFPGRSGFDVIASSCSRKMPNRIRIYEDHMAQMVLCGPTHRRV